MSSGTHRPLSALGVAVVLLVTACGDDSGSDAAEDPPPNDDQSASAEEASPSGDAPPDEAAEAAEGFDECSLVPPDELAQLMGVEELHITGRGAAPQAGGGWSFGCIYHNRAVPGLGTLNISVITGAEREPFFEPFASASTEEVALGDHAERADVPLEGTTGLTSELRALQGDVGLEIIYTYPGSHTDLPLPDDVMSSGLPELVLERIPEDVAITEMISEGPCAALDVEQASQVLGGDLVGARSVVDDTGAARCGFSGEEVDLTVNVFTDQEIVSSMTMQPADINVSDLGDGAAVGVYPDPVNQTWFMAATINDGDRIVDVSADYSPALGAINEARPEDIEMVRGILEAVSQ